MINGAHDFRLANLEREIKKYATAEEFLRELNRGLQTLGEKEIDGSYLSQLRSTKPNSRNIGPRTARKIEKGLGLEPGSFDLPPEDKPNQTEADLESEEVARKFRDLSPDQQALVRQTIETLRRQNLSDD